MKTPVLACLALCLPTLASAEIEIGIYGGLQTARPSDILVRGDSVAPDADFRQEWEGKPFEWPIYVGVRITQWRTDTFGWGLDWAHNKTYPKDDELPAGYNALEFTDGLNTWTINAYKRWPGQFGDVTPYVGGGLGLSIPGVEVTYQGNQTFEYQITGFAATWLAGISYPINDTWKVFGEYKGTYTTNEVDLDTGGTLSTDIFTNALNIGVSYSF